MMTTLRITLEYGDKSIVTEKQNFDSNSLHPDVFLESMAPIFRQESMALALKVGAYNPLAAARQKMRASGAFTEHEIDEAMP